MQRYLLLLFSFIGLLFADGQIFIKQTLVPNKTISPNSLFSLKVNVKNSLNSDLKYIKIYGDIDIDLKLIALGDKRFRCKKGKDNHFECKFRYLLKSNESINLKLKLKSPSYILNDTTNTIFVDVKEQKSSQNLSFADTIAINMQNIQQNRYQKRFSIKMKNLTSNSTTDDDIYLGLWIDGDKGIDQNSLKIEFRIDKNLAFKRVESDEYICSESDGVVKCRLKDGKVLAPLVISLKAKRFGFMINEVKVIDINTSTEEIDTVSFDVGEVFQKKIELQTSSFKYAEVGEKFTYKIRVKNLTNNQLYQIPIRLEFLGGGEIEYLSTNDSDFECNSDSNRLFCQIKNLKAHENKEFNIELKAPNKKNFFQVVTYLNDKKVANSSFDIVEFNYNKDRVSNLKQVDINATKSKLLLLSSKNICQKDSNGKCIQDLNIPNDKLYLEPKGLLDRSLYRELGIKDNQKILWAKLYWIGKIDKLRDSDLLTDAKKVKLVKKGLDSIEIESDKDGFFYKNSDNSLIYQGSAVVTKYIQKGRNGLYGVKDISSSKGVGAISQWALAVLVSTKDSRKSAQIYDGFIPLWSSKEFTNSKKWRDSFALKLPNSATQMDIFSADMEYPDGYSIRVGTKRYKTDATSFLKSVDVNSNDKKDLNITSLGDRFYLGFITVE